MEKENYNKKIRISGKCIRRKKLQCFELFSHENQKLKLCPQPTKINCFRGEAIHLKNLCCDLRELSLEKTLDHDGGSACKVTIALPPPPPLPMMF